MAFGYTTACADATQKRTQLHTQHKWSRHIPSVTGGVRSSVLGGLENKASGIWSAILGGHLVIQGETYGESF